jgi:hypothetical protein
MPIALDYTTRIAPAALTAAGVTICCRYLSWLHFWSGTTHTGINPKIIQKAEYDELTAAGLTVILNWEYDAQDWLSGSSGGVTHAVEAVQQARALGYPAGAPIVGSADFNMSRAQWDSAGKAYASAFVQTLTAAGYRAGVYGPWDVLAWCAAEVPGFSVFWQAGMSTSWSGGRNANPWPGAHLRQRAYLTVGGVQGDRNDILKEPIGMALTQADLDAIWNYKIGGTGGPAGAAGPVRRTSRCPTCATSCYPRTPAATTAGSTGRTTRWSGRLDQLIAALDAAAHRRRHHRDGRPDRHRPGRLPAQRPRRRRSRRDRRRRQAGAARRHRVGGGARRPAAQRRHADSRGTARPVHPADPRRPAGTCVHTAPGTRSGTPAGRGFQGRPPGSRSARRQTPRTAGPATGVRPDSRRRPDGSTRGGGTAAELMCWPWWCRGFGHRTAWKAKHEAEEASRTRADAERKLDETTARDPEIQAIAHRLESLRRQNRFAAMIEDALRRQP